MGKVKGGQKKGFCFKCKKKMKKHGFDDHIRDCWYRCKRCNIRFSWAKAHEEHEEECEEDWTCDVNCRKTFDTEGECASHEQGC